MKSFYDSIHDLSNIQAIIDSAQRESEVLEYKSAVAQFGNNERVEISKDVSAMANASGGVIIFGIRTDQRDKTKPVEIEGIHESNIETFDRVINSQIPPSIKGIQKKLLPSHTPRVMVVYVPQSENPPHQDLYKKKYYRRSMSESIPMDHALIATLFGKRFGPILSVKFQILGSRELVFSGDPPTTDPLQLRVFIRNDGKRVGRYVQLVMQLPTEGVTDFQVNRGRVIDQLRPGKIARQFTNNVGVFHPQLDVSILEIGFRIKKKFFEHDAEPLIEWSLHADEMDPQFGTLSLKDIGPSSCRN